MKALVYHAPKDMRWEDFENPIIKDNEVLVGVKSVGVCGSDLHGYLGLTGRRTPPMIMGHEFAGIVLEIGKNVKSVKIGDRVTAQPIVFCGKCDFCLNGQTSRCSNRFVFGVMSFNGALAEKLAVPERLIFKLPESISYDEGALIEPMAVSYGAVKKIKDSLKGKSVLIIGAGTIGYFASLWCKHFGARKIFFSDIIQERLNIINKDHIDAIINPKNEDLLETIISKNDGKRPDFTIEAVGINNTVNQSLSVLAPGGTALWIGNSDPTVEINMQNIVTNEISIIGTYMFSHTDFADVIKTLENKPFDFLDIVNLREKMDVGEKVFQNVIENPNSVLKAIVYLD